MKQTKLAIGFKRLLTGILYQKQLLKDKLPIFNSKIVISRNGEGNYNNLC